MKLLLSGPKAHDELSTVPDIAASMSSNAVIRWLFADRRTGRLVIGQRPNALLWLVLGATAGRLVSGRSAAGPALRAVQAGALRLWALDEAVRGVNPFRRIGGAVVFAALLRRGSW